MPEHSREELWIQRAIVAMNITVQTSHTTHHPMSTHRYDVCNLGTCGNLNSLIREAQNMGYHDPSIPERL